jgi:hypothetical protein
MKDAAFKGVTEDPDVRGFYPLVFIAESFCLLDDNPLCHHKAPRRVK